MVISVIEMPVPIVPMVVERIVDMPAL